MPSPKRILVVDNVCVEQSRRGLYRALAGSGEFEIHLMVPASWREQGYPIPAEPGEDARLHLRQSGFLFGYRAHRVVYTGLHAALKELQPDILFIETEPENYAAFQAVFLCKRLSPRTRVVFTSWRNIEYPPGTFPYKLPRIHDVVERYVLKHAHHSVAHIESAREIFEKLGFRSISVIPPCVDTRHFSPLPPGQRKHRPFIIGYIGRFIREKGIDLLLRAAQGLPFPYHLFLAGSGPEKEPLRALAASLGMAGDVTFREPALYHEVPGVLHSLDVLALPSITGSYWKEQFGRVLTEAMACGIPVIGSDSGEIPRVIGEAGLVFREKNIEELRDHLIMLHANLELRSELRRKGLERVAHNFSLEVVAARYEELFNFI